MRTTRVQCVQHRHHALQMDVPLSPRVLQPSRICGTMREYLMPRQSRSRELRPSDYRLWCAAALPPRAGAAQTNVHAGKMMMRREDRAAMLSRYAHAHSRRP